MVWSIVKVFLAALAISGQAMSLNKNDNDQKSLNAAGDMQSKMPIQMAPDTAATDAAGEVIKGIEAVPAPGKVLTTRIDPDVMGIDSCDRDYSAPCPLHFVSISSAGGTLCAPRRSYEGPCASDSIVPATMSHSAKIRWSKQCLAYWPCSTCGRNYSNPCPEGWKQEDGGSTCAPKSEYKGPCESQNFGSYNSRMLEAWQSKCGAYWKCQDSLSVDTLQSSYPLSRQATLQRIARGEQ